MSLRAGTPRFVLHPRPATYLQLPKTLPPICCSPFLQQNLQFSPHISPRHSTTPLTPSIEAISRRLIALSHPSSRHQRRVQNLSLPLSPARTQCPHQTTAPRKVLWARLCRPSTLMATTCRPVQHPAARTLAANTLLRRSWFTQRAAISTMPQAHQFTR